MYGSHGREILIGYQELQGQGESTQYPCYAVASVAGCLFVQREYSVSSTLQSVTALTPYTIVVLSDSVKYFRLLVIFYSNHVF